MRHFLTTLATTFVAFWVLTSCQSNEFFESLSFNYVENKISDVPSLQKNSCTKNYWESLEPINWAELNSLEERFKFFNLSESQVK